MTSVVVAQGGNIVAVGVDSRMRRVFWSNTDFAIRGIYSTSVDGGDVTTIATRGADHVKVALILPQNYFLHISRLCGQTCTKRTVWWSARLLVFSSGPTRNDVTFKSQATTDLDGKQSSGAVWSTREEWLSIRTRSKLKIQTILQTFTDK